MVAVPSNNGVTDLDWDILILNNAYNNNAVVSNTEIYLTTITVSMYIKHDTKRSQTQAHATCHSKRQLL